MQTLRMWSLHNKGTLAFITILSLLQSGSIIVQAISIVKTVDLVFIREAAFSAVFPFLWMLAAAIIIRLATQLFITRLGGQLAASVKSKVRAELLQHWSDHTFLLQGSQQTGSNVTLFTETVNELESYYRDYIPQVIKTTVIPMVVLAAVFFTHPTSALIMMITAPFIPLTYIIIGMQTKAKSEEQLVEMNRFSGKFLDLLQGLQTLRLFGQSKKQRTVLAANNESFMNATLSVLKIAFASTLFIELITTLGIGLVALEVGFRMIVFETLAFAPAFLVLTLAPEFYNALKELGAAFHTGRGSLGAASLLEEALQKRSVAVQWGEKQVPPKPSLSLHDAVFSYKGGAVIGPLSLSIPSGQTIAMIGPTGHGKTTALYMLAGMVELQSGSTLIDSIPRNEISEECWYKEMTYIAQHSYLFAGTLRDNICMGQNCSDERVIAALKEAQLLEWFRSLPAGLDTNIGEAGRGLSGGEKQRVALARAFLKKPSVVFFDEPTAGLDVLTEKLLTAAIKKLGQNATVVIVAHRFESILHADYIYILENGCLTASGTHRELTDHPFYQFMKQGGMTDADPAPYDLA